jgi:hypothetical protein
VAIEEMSMLLKNIHLPTLKLAMDWQRGDVADFIAPSTWMNFDLRHLTDSVNSIAAIDDVLSIAGPTARATLPPPPVAPKRSHVHVHRSRSRSIQRPSDTDICDRFDLNEEAISALDRVPQSERSRILSALLRSVDVQRPSHWVVAACRRASVSM